MASPIEDILHEAICAAVPSCRSVDGNTTMLAWHAGYYAFLERNAPVSTYRVDLLLIPGRPVVRPGGSFDGDRIFALAIECDGHEFHDRTKQQAAYDRARDRELLLRTITTIRFTGSEIFHSPERCAHEALAIYQSMVDRAASDRTIAQLNRAEIVAGMGG